MASRVAATTTKRRAAVRKATQPPSPTNSDVAPGDELPRDVRCEYPSKFCNNHKALKTKGGMHKFCEYHRRKANLNQKRWQQRRRELREQGRGKHVADPAPNASEIVMATPAKILGGGDGELVALSPTDDIEPFPISAFTTTPPPNAVDRLTDTVHHDGPSEFPVGDDLDMLTTLFFNDSQTNTVAMYNWPAASTSYGVSSASINTSGYTMTGPGAAIV